MFEWGGGGGRSERGMGVHPLAKKIQVLKFKCLKWLILIEMRAKYGIYLYLLCQQRGDIPPFVGVEEGVGTPRTPPGGNPGAFIIE